jgi:hypothetical protein
VFLDKSGNEQYYYFYIIQKDNGFQEGTEIAYVTEDEWKS